MASAFEVLGMSKNSFYDNTPTANLYQNAAQSIPTGSTFSTAILFQTESEDNWGGHSNVTNTSRYTCQVAGMYLVSATLTFAFNGNLMVRALAIFKNGANLNYANTYNQSYSSNYATCTSTIMLRMAVGDYVEMYGWQNSGAALNTVPFGTNFAIAYMHA